MAMHNKILIHNFLMHLAAELQERRHAFLGKRPSDKLLQGIKEFREKYGTSLVPTAIDGPWEVEAQPAMAKQRAEQLAHVVAVIKMLGDLDFEGSQPE